MKQGLENKMKQEKGENIWKTHIPYVPFGFFSVLINKNIDKYHWSISKSNTLGISLSVLNTFLFGIYLSSSLALSSFNPLEWSEISNKRNLQKEIQQQEIYKKSFYKLDKNKDYVIDSTKFIYQNK